MFVQRSFLCGIGWLVNLRSPAWGRTKNLLTRKGNALLNELSFSVEYIGPSGSRNKNFPPVSAGQPDSKPLHLPIFLFLAIGEGLHNLPE